MTNLLAKVSNWKFILPAFLGFIYCLYLFQTYGAQLNVLAGEEAPIIDMRRDYEVAEIKDFFTKIQPEGRQIHQFVSGVVDMIFPFAYGLLFILSTAFFLKKITSPDSKWMYLSLFPILLMIADYIENFNTLDMLEKFPDLTTEMVDSASTITGIKAILTNISMGLPLVLGVIWLIKWLRERNEAS